jgi:hypothetical protein
LRFTKEDQGVPGPTVDPVKKQIAAQAVLRIYARKLINPDAYRDKIIMPLGGPTLSMPSYGVWKTGVPTPTNSYNTIASDEEIRAELIQMGEDPDTFTAY